MDLHLLKLEEAHVIGSIISLILGLFIVPAVIYFSEKKGLVDKPNERKIHSIPVPRLGGIAIWLSTMITFVFLIFLSYYPKGALLSGILLGSSLIFLLGLVDDIYGLNAKFKLLIQILIATVVYLLGINIDSVSLFGSSIDLGLWSYPITILWIVGISNAVNFIDGIDGLAGSLIMISSVTIGLIAIALPNPSTVTTLIAFILAGSMLGFLGFNFNPAKIFMGDSGSLFGGFLLAILSITGIVKSGSSLIFLPILILIVPIFDIIFVSTRRILHGKSPFVADAEHLHHQLLKLGLTQNKTVLTLASVAVIACGISTYLITPRLTQYFLYVLAILTIMFLLSHFAKK